MASGVWSKFVAPCSNLSVFGTNVHIDESACGIFGLFDDPAVIWRQGNCPPSLRPWYAVLLYSHVMFFCWNNPRKITFGWFYGSNRTSKTFDIGKWTLSWNNWVALSYGIAKNIFAVSLMFVIKCLLFPWENPPCWCCTAKVPYSLRRWYVNNCSKSWPVFIILVRTSERLSYNDVHTSIFNASTLDRYVEIILHMKCWH